MQGGPGRPAQVSSGQEVVRCCGHHQSHGGQKRMRMVMIMLAAIMMISSAGAAGSAPAPDAYGRVVISNYSQKAGLAPVVFDHWVHRTQYTCRLCHIDIGFAMKANLTEIRAADNSKGVYCGVCHNGKMQA